MEGRAPLTISANPFGIEVPTSQKVGPYYSDYFMVVKGNLMSAFGLPRKLGPSPESTPLINRWTRSCATVQNIVDGYRDIKNVNPAGAIQVADLP